MRLSIKLLVRLSVKLFGEAVRKLYVRLMTLMKLMTLIKSNIVTEADMLTMLMKLIMLMRLMKLMKLNKVNKLLVKLVMKPLGEAVCKAVW